MTDTPAKKKEPIDFSKIMKLHRKGAELRKIYKDAKESDSELPDKPEPTQSNPA